VLAVFISKRSGKRTKKKRSRQKVENTGTEKAANKGIAIFRLRWGVAIREGRKACQGHAETKFINMTAITKKKKNDRARSWNLEK